MNRGEFKLLPMFDLDDRRFDEMVREARRAIPKYSPEWTDENVHDPGISLIELFAWLSEMQQYYLTRITGRNELKFLKLLGMRPGIARPARAEVAFGQAERDVWLPAGLRLLAQDQPFETTEPLLVLAARLERMIVRTEAESNDYTSSNDHVGVSFPAFGSEAREGSRMYLAFDRGLPVGRPVSLSFRLFEDYPVAEGKPPASTSGVGSGFAPSARISWKYYGIRGGEESLGWYPLEPVSDDTAHLSRSGRVRFRVPDEMRPMMIPPANDKRRYWICATVEEEGYELPPKIEKITLNAVPVEQRETASRSVLRDSTGEPGLAVEVDDELSLRGLLKVQVRGGDGYWRYWEERETLAGLGAGDRCFAVFRDEAAKRTRIVFGDGAAGAVPPAGEGRIRIISYRPEFDGQRLTGRTDGLPGQTFRLDERRADYVRRLAIQVGVRLPGEEELAWEDWERVDDFDHSAAYDRHYVFRRDTGEIQFGDNEHGFVPEACPQRNVAVIDFQLGGGERGNVKSGAISEMPDRWEEVRGMTVANAYFAAGGSEPETLEEAKLRALRQLQAPTRAVTNADCEEIARNTPGLRVARVKAIPLYVRGLRDYPRQKAPGQITVVVVPYSEKAKPLPSPGFLDTVKRHLDRHRLLATQIHVIPPEYIKITVNAVVVVEPFFKDSAAAVKEALRRLLQPLDTSDGSIGWQFGRTVYKGDIYGAISRVPGVAFIQDLWLSAEGKGAEREEDGDIRLPPHGLVYSGEHDIELVSRTDL